MTEPTSAQEFFKGRHFDREIIVLCVRWYLTFKLSSRDLVQMMTERGILLAHATILRWVQRYVPDFEKRWQAYARPVGNSCRVDVTYIKVKGQWVRQSTVPKKLGDQPTPHAHHKRSVRARQSQAGYPARHSMPFQVKSASKSEAM
jgi:hypothetical protein